ncbi:hypothetical protein [Nibrella saemangeumensis]|uniref:hypothetical protein n=1 Tax=Nibrella saemangeumensis TaxID=1084526 RepID=UPI0031ECD23B
MARCKLLPGKLFLREELLVVPGFADPRYLSRVFTEEFGVSRGSFRQLSQP